MSKDPRIPRKKRRHEGDTDLQTSNPQSEPRAKKRPTCRSLMAEFNACPTREELERERAIDRAEVSTGTQTGDLSLAQRLNHAPNVSHDAPDPSIHDAMEVDTDLLHLQMAELELEVIVTDPKKPKETPSEDVSTVRALVPYNEPGQDSQFMVHMLRHCSDECFNTMSIENVNVVPKNVDSKGDVKKNVLTWVSEMLQSNEVGRGGPNAAELDPYSAGSSRNLRPIPSHLINLSMEMDNVEGREATTCQCRFHQEKHFDVAKSRKRLKRNVILMDVTEGNDEKHELHEVEERIDNAPNTSSSFMEDDEE